MKFRKFYGIPLLGPHASIARCLGSTPGQGTNISQAKCPPTKKKKSFEKRNLTSLVAQLVKNPRAMQETPVQFLGQGDPLKKG